MVCPIPKSGRLGFVGDFTGSVLTRFSRVKNWTFESLMTPEIRIYSGTRFGTQRLPGFTTNTGSFMGFGGVPPLFAGDLFTFIGYTAPTNGIACTPGCSYSVPSIVDSVNINWNWTAENRGVSWTINFSSTNDYTPVNFDDPCDDNVFCDPNTCNLTFVMKNPCAADAVIEWCNLVSASLTFTAANVPYSNNSTNCTIVKDIGNLDWTLEVVDQNPCFIPTKGADYLFEIMSTLSPSTKWILKWGQCLGFTNLNVNIETAEIISKTNNFAMQAVNCCVPGTPVRGAITNPSGVIVWPYSTAS